MRSPVLALLAVVFSACPVVAQPKGKGPKLPPGTKVHRDLAYGTHQRNRLDLAVPPGDGPFPLVLWVHGGGWTNGSKEGGGPTVALLQFGYAVAAMNYRFSQHAVFPAQIHDVKAAVRYLRANARKFHLNPNRFGVAGGSAGGHLVALLGTSGGVKELEGNRGNGGVSSAVQAVCDIYGPADLTQVSLTDRADGLVAKLLGGPAAKKSQLARLASPITHVDKDDPPLIIIHGDKDPLVPVGQSRAFDEALRKSGVESTLIIVPGAAHNLNQVLTQQVKTRVKEFFDKHLKK